MATTANHQSWLRLPTINYGYSVRFRYFP
jgi:creatinine amidohydrolase/Fe(II)-dependent formamide hydrolase-like protein